MLETNPDSQSMEGSRTKAAYSGTDIKPAARGSYETRKSGAWKIWHINPHARTKGGGNKNQRLYQYICTTNRLQNKSKR